MNKSIAVLISAIAGFFALSQIAAAEDKPPPTVQKEVRYATVNGKVITQEDFHGAYSSYLRQKFYHGQVPADQLEPARKEVSNRLVERILLLDEATRRGLAADEKQVAMTIAEYDARYANNPMWQKNRESMMPALKRQLAEQDLLRQMEVIGHAMAEPTEEAVQVFYKSRMELFTEPEKMRLHTILLKVDPSAPKPLWEAAREEAGRIVARLRSGEGNFEELAGLHSHDGSAEKGGDMGYVHLGMIPGQVQTQLEAIPLGMVGDPIDMLDGVAIFRLDGRIPPKIMAYQDVAVRARELLKREQRDQAWDSFIVGLRKTAVIKIAEIIPSPANK